MWKKKWCRDTRQQFDCNNKVTKLAELWSMSMPKELLKKGIDEKSDGDLVLLLKEIILKNDISLTKFL